MHTRTQDKVDEQIWIHDKGARGNDSYREMAENKNVEKNQEKKKTC